MRLAGEDEGERESGKESLAQFARERSEITARRLPVAVVREKLEQGKEGGAEIASGPSQQQVDQRAYPRAYVETKRALAARSAYRAAPSSLPASAFKRPASAGTQRSALAADWAELGPVTPTVPGDVTYTGAPTTTSGRVTTLAVDPDCGKPDKGCGRPRGDGPLDVVERRADLERHRLGRRRPDGRVRRHPVRRHGGGERVERLGGGRRPVQVDERRRELEPRPRQPGRRARPRDLVGRDRPYRRGPHLHRRRAGSSRRLVIQRRTAHPARRSAARALRVIQRRHELLARVLQAGRSRGSERGPRHPDRCRHQGPAGSQRP